MRNFSKHKKLFSGDILAESPMQFCLCSFACIEASARVWFIVKCLWLSPCKIKKTFHRKCDQLPSLQSLEMEFRYFQIATRTTGHSAQPPPPKENWISQRKIYQKLKIRQKLKNLLKIEKFVKIGEICQKLKIR